MANFTKGEWTAAKTGTGAEVGIDDDVIADVYSCRTGIALANAHLIVTAVNACQQVNPDNPQTVAESIKDMYEALKALIEHMTMSRGELGRPYLADVRRMADKALTKAEGKEV